MKFNVRLAYREDISGMYKIEKASFAMPWSYESFAENFYNAFSVYVLAENDDGDILGFGGMQVIFDEAHIMNVAVKKDFRRCGIADKLIELMQEEASKRKAEKMFLEVRHGNEPAKSLYLKHGFKQIAVRKGYYSDNGENAIIMVYEMI